MTFAQACTDCKSHGVGENKKIIIRNTAETGLQSSFLTCLIILRQKRAQQHWQEIWHAWLLLKLTESPTLAAPFLLLFFWICGLGWRRGVRYGREDKGQNPGASNLQQSTTQRERELQAGIKPSRLQSRDPCTEPAANWITSLSLFTKRWLLLLLFTFDAVTIFQGPQLLDLETKKRDKDHRDLFFEMSLFTKPLEIVAQKESPSSRNLCWDCWFSSSSSMIVVVWALILDCPLQTEAEKMLQYALLSYNTWEEAWRMASPAPLPTAAAEIWGWWDAGSRQEDLLWSTAWILCTH